MSTLSKHWLLALAAAVIVSLAWAGPSLAVVKLIGDFEGNMASPYTVVDPVEPTNVGGCAQDAGPLDWCADGGIVNDPSDPTNPGLGVPPTFIDLNNPAHEPFWGGVTHGEQALLFTFPGAWGSIQGPYLRLQGHEELLNDVSASGFQYMAFDVTTFGGYDEPPEDVPEGQGPFRQVFTIFEGQTIGFYGRNESGDEDVQIDWDMAAWDEVSSTTTLIQGLTGALPPTSGDGQIATNLLTTFENTSDPDFFWNLVLVFQGRDYPPPVGAIWEVNVAIDNFRLCNTEAECLAPPILVGDYNDNGVVDAADYTVWRANVGNPGASLPNRDPANTGVVGLDDYTSWKTSFGNVAGAGALSSAAVPEPSALVLALMACVGLLSRRRNRN